MKKLSELITWTLFFSVLGGFGASAGFFCFIGVAHVLGRMLG